MLLYTAIERLHIVRRLDAARLIGASSSMVGVGSPPPVLRPIEGACRRCPWLFLALARERVSRSRPTAI